MGRDVKAAKGAGFVVTPEQTLVLSQPICTALCHSEIHQNRGEEKNPCAKELKLVLIPLELNMHEQESDTESTS